jgi:hypothetical protein
MGNGQRVVVPIRRPVSEALRLLAEAGGDEPLNAAWDDLMHTALRAWTWRDPDTLRALTDAIARVRPFVARDWPS